METVGASAAPPPRTTTIQAHTAKGLTPSATIAPKPDSRADGTPRIAAAKALTRPVAADTPSAAMSQLRISTRVRTPNGPTSDWRMISSALAAGAPLPSPSAVSASPSRCRPRVSQASTATASTAPRNVACGTQCRIAAAGKAATAPATPPTTGNHSSADTPSPGASSARARTGTSVNRLTDRTSVMRAPRDIARQSSQPLRDACRHQPDLLGRGGEALVQLAEEIAKPPAGPGRRNDPAADLVTDGDDA